MSAHGSAEHSTSLLEKVHLARGGACPHLFVEVEDGVVEVGGVALALSVEGEDGQSAADSLGQNGRMAEWNTGMGG